MCLTSLPICYLNESGLYFKGEAEFAAAKLKGLEQDPCTIQPNYKNRNVLGGSASGYTPNNQTGRPLNKAQLSKDQWKVNQLKANLDQRNTTPRNDPEKVEEAKFKLLQAPKSPAEERLAYEEGSFRYVAKMSGYVICESL